METVNIKPKELRKIVQLVLASLAIWRLPDIMTVLFSGICSLIQAIR